MKILLIGGTGRISTAVSKLICDTKMELWMINRGSNPEFVPENTKVIVSDIIDERAIAEKISNVCFDVVVDFVVKKPSDIERDFRLFNGKTKQYIFISSASVYQKNHTNYIITEKTPLENPFWKYSQDKIECERKLIELYKEEGFPATIVRPSQTYGDTMVPTAVRGRQGSFSVVNRIKLGKPVVIPGDGTSLWTITHNSDFAKGFLGLLGNNAAIGETFHITSDEVLTWNRIYETIANALGVTLNPLYVTSATLARLSEDFEGSLLGDKSNSMIFDNSKIKRFVPGFSATKKLADGIETAIKYIYLNEKEQVEEIEFDNWCDELAESIKNQSNHLPKY